MDRAWALVLVTLLGSCAQTPASNAPIESSSPTNGSEVSNASAATRAPVPGASNPHECEDAPASEPKLKTTPLLSDDALVELESCTQRLGQPGSLGIAVLSKGDGAAAKVVVTESTVRDCRVVECVKERLAKVPTSTKARHRQNVELTLAPHGPVQAVKHIDWPPGKSNYCADPADELGEFKNGRLAPERIQQIIRERYGDFRKCYESGLASNPQLSGQVRIRFVIGGDGHVSDAYIQDNELPDCRVAQCIRSEMAKTVFPQPEGGIVTVVYPIMLSPG